MFYNPTTSTTYTLSQLRRAFPNVSWPANPTDAALAAHGLVRVVTTPPTVEPWQSAQATTVAKQGSKYVMQYKVIEPALDAMKATKLAELKAYRRTKEEAGINLNGVGIATDRESQAMIGNAVAGLRLKPGVSTVNWKAENGTFVLDLATLEAIAGAVFDHVQACFKAEITHVEAINALTDAQAVYNFDYSSAWPA